MNIHEFGKENNEIILLIHPSVVKWDYFENVIPLLQEKYHLLTYSMQWLSRAMLSWLIRNI